MLIISTISGIVLGYVAAKMLFLQYATLFPWSLAGLLIGYFSNTKIESLKNGAIYGFLLGSTFMAVIYEGSAPIISRIPFFIVLGFVSAACGTLLSIFAFLTKQRIARYSK